jgi:hypothetical protein
MMEVSGDDPGGKCDEPMSNPDKTTVVTYTTAEAAYDGFGTTTLCEVGRTTNGKTIRKVETPALHLRWQRMRYASGCKMVADEAEYQKLVGYDLVRPLAEAS